MGRNKGRQGLRLTHYVSLSGFGGVEQQFVTFAARAARRHAVEQSVVVCSTKVHAHHRELLPNFEDWRYEKKLFGFKVGQHPAALRRMRYRWLGRRFKPDVALLWNRLDQQARVIDALGVRRCLYWEHGSAWLHGDDEARADVLSRVPAVICNSHAAKRMLQLRWGYQGAVRVCPNGMRNRHTVKDFKQLPRDRALHIGVAGRLVPVKATCLALHTLAALHRRGIKAAMSIAGDGPLRAELEELARSLNVATHVRFLGVVKDMALFFSEIDLLLHPALREPFGVVVAEAGAMGCPVVCTAVDGLPEVVDHEQTGLCVAPTADLARYRELGGSSDGLPAAVYMPGHDMIDTPKVCEPQDLADAVESVTANAERFSAMSDRAMVRVAQRFNFDSHVDDVMNAVKEYHATGTLEPGQ
ncbi:group 1 glycosyl transferase [Salinisphaera sp. C84B14]|uniref:glycosyltransferase n=1 Tax=Salinisphaera sp. C84B14 TaxID=1304155 RepID=UPI003342886B